jgi:hypothetical protein
MCTLRTLMIIITATITERALTTFPAHQYRAVMMNVFARDAGYLHSSALYMHI